MFVKTNVTLPGFAIVFVESLKKNSPPLTRTVVAVARVGRSERAEATGTSAMAASAVAASVKIERMMSVRITDRLLSRFDTRNNDCGESPARLRRQRPFELPTAPNLAYLLSTSQRSDVASNSASPVVVAGKRRRDLVHCHGRSIGDRQTADHRAERGRRIRSGPDHPA